MGRRRARAPRARPSMRFLSGRSTNQTVPAAASSMPPRSDAPNTVRKRGATTDSGFLEVPRRNAHGPSAPEGATHVIRRARRREPAPGARRLPKQVRLHWGRLRVGGATGSVVPERRDVPRSPPPRLGRGLTGVPIDRAQLSDQARLWKVERAKRRLKTRSETRQRDADHGTDQHERKIRCLTLLLRASIADPPHGLDALRGEGAHLLADARDVAVDGAVAAVSALGQGAVRDLRPALRAPRPLSQEREHVELVRGEAEDGSVTARRPRVEVEHDVGEGQLAAGRLAPQREPGPDARDELLHEEGLGHEVDRAGVEALAAAPADPSAPTAPRSERTCACVRCRAPRSR
jgi:hypothetical protein